VSSPNVVAFIHAKGTSERLPGKNMADLGGMPLFAHAVKAAQAAVLVDRVVVDSDSDEILQIALELGSATLNRPADLATNKTTGDDLAYWQASNAGGASTIVQVVPTSPFISGATIDNAIRRLRPHGVSVVGVRMEHLYLWTNGWPAYRSPSGELPNSKDLPVSTWETTGLYAVATAYALRTHRRIDPDDCLFLALSQIEAIDINTAEDLEFARIVWAGMQARKTET